MKTLEESIAAAMDAQQDTAIIPFLPYILQDFWGLGTPIEIALNLIQKNYKNYSNLKVLDLGCGKWAVSVQLAVALKCNCYGIDGISEFVETAKAKAREYEVDTLCRFEVGDVHPSYMFRKDLLKQFEQAGMELVDETVGQYGEWADIAKEMEKIVARCNELKAKYPEKSSLFENYAQNQASEYDVLENEMSGSIMVLKINKLNE